MIAANAGFRVFRRSSAKVSIGLLASRTDRNTVEAQYQILPSGPQASPRIMKSRIPLPQGAGQKLSAAELAALKHKSQERDRRIAASEDVSGGEMFLIRPAKARAARIRWPKASIR